jgi:hypothetical protein
LILHEAKEVGKLTRSSRRWFGRRLGRHDRQGGWRTASGGERCRALGARKRGGASFSPQREALGVDTGNGEAAAKEIDAGGRASVAVRVWLGLAGQGEALGAGSLYERSGMRGKTRGGRGDAHRRRGAPGGRPAMARQRNSQAAARVGARRECGGLIGGEGQLQDPRVGFIEREGGRGGDDREQWP